MPVTQLPFDILKGTCLSDVAMCFLSVPSPLQGEVWAGMSSFFLWSHGDNWFRTEFLCLWSRKEPQGYTLAIWNMRHSIPKKHH